MTFLQLYGTKLDRELGSSDRTSRFTTVLRKEYVNEGQRVFNEHTSCFVKRVALAITTLVQEVDLEATSVITAGDYLWPSKTSASLRRYDGSGSANTDYSYVEGPDLVYKTEEELNQIEPGWRAASAGTPRYWYLREDSGSLYFGLHPTPSIPAAETWTVYFPYVAIPADMSADADIPYSVSGNARTTLIPYHEAILAYAAAQLEKLRKNWDGVERQMKIFAAYVAKYTGDKAPKRGSTIRLKTDYRNRPMANVRLLDPARFP